MVAAPSLAGASAVVVLGLVHRPTRR